MAHRIRIRSVPLMVHRDLVAVSPFMYGVAVEMRRAYDGMVKVSMGSWEYRLSLAINMRLGSLPSMIQLLTYWQGRGGRERER